MRPPNMEQGCTVIECDRPVRAKGKCRRHYDTAVYATTEGKAAHAARAAAHYAEHRVEIAARSATYRATAKGKATQAAYRASDARKATSAATGAVRRALKAGAAIGEPFAHAAIFDRDGWICGVCSLPVDRTLAYPDPHSASLDHVIPLAKLGAHSEANAQLAHLVCNMRKGARLNAAITYLGGAA